MVSNASDDLPEPERPVSTTSWLRGMSTSTDLRLCSRAPRTAITGPSGRCTCGLSERVLRGESALGIGSEGLANTTGGLKEAWPGTGHSTPERWLEDRFWAIVGDTRKAPAGCGRREKTMAGSVNKVILIGNLGADPEVRSTQDGNKVVNLRIATSESWKDRASGERKERTEWHRVVIFNERLAEVAERYLKKGSKVYIEGALQTRKWTDNSGAE